VALLEVDDLRVCFDTPDGAAEAVRGVSFVAERGRTLGIVGESGSGKTVATQAIFGFAHGARVEGVALFEGRDLLHMPARERRALLGRRVGMVFQDPLSSLHPMYRVGWQIIELIRAHDRSVSRRAARERAVELLGMVGIPQPDRRVDDFPHQFSGGMRQRVMIAMAMALGPSLLVADEPTTALDVTVQAQILELIERLSEELGTAVILITHDLGVVAEFADEVAVFYAGRVMEQGSTRQLFYEYRHPYTEGLFLSLPTANVEPGHLVPIPGQPPSAIAPPGGCPFAARCRYRMEKCWSQQPELAEVARHPGHRSACFLPQGVRGL